MTISYTQEQLPNAAKRLLEAFPAARVFALQGGMGSGKTTLVAAICHELDVQNTASSPTFPIINEYSLPGGEPVYHIDLYRLANAEEAVAAGVEEALYSGYYCFVEWPELAPDIFPNDTVYGVIHTVSATERTLELPADSGLPTKRGDKA